MIVLISFAPLAYLFTFKGMRFFEVPSASMEPTILTNDYILTLTGNEYHRGDIIVLIDPESPKEYLVKRIVGIGGDVVSVQGGAVFINGKYASEPYRMEPIDYVMPGFEVPDDEIFVLGDNSNWSIDSHNWGADPNAGPADRKGKPDGVPVESIIGRVKLIYLPRARMQRVHAYPLTNIDGR